MKKLVKFLLPFLCLNAGLLSGCGNDNRIMLSFGDMHASDVVDVSINDIDTKVKNKESFMLAVSSNTCACWLDFQPVIQNYVTENHLYCAHISYNDFKNFASTYDIQLTSSTTTFVVFRNGVAEVKLMSSIEDKTLKDINVFKKFMNGTVKMPKMYMINENDVATIKSSKKNAVVYFERTGCDDCTFINNTLFDYFDKHENSNNMYVLDCQPWKSLSSEEYQSKKDEFGISAVNNPTYGANIGTDQGVFPFFSYISNGDYASGAGAFNGAVSNVGDKYVVQDSYYTAERVPKLDYTDKVIKGYEIPANDVSDNGKYVMWMKDKSIEFYKPIITSFLDVELAKANFSF